MKTPLTTKSESVHHPRSVEQLIVGKETSDGAGV
jgi:hypothetical protein